MEPAGIAFPFLALGLIGLVTLMGAIIFERPVHQYILGTAMIFAYPTIYIWLPELIKMF